MILGSHVTFSPKQLLSSVEEAIKFGSNTFMFYTGAPTNTIRKDIKEDYLSKAKELMKENNIDINNVICHAPYIINLGNKKNIEKYNFSIDFLKKEILRCEELGIKTLVLHPGNAVGITKEEGINNIINALQEVIKVSKTVTIALETMSGKGTECGSNTEEITHMINSLDNDLIGICIDTCHISDSGYNIENFNEYLEELLSKIPLSKIKCLHINDSKNEVGSHKDRHANLGFGTLGFDNILNVIYHEKLKDIPKILETPYIEKIEGSNEKIYPPYKQEIEMIKDKKFNPNILEDIRKYYQK